MVGLAAARVGAVRLGIDVDAVVQAIPVLAAQALLPRRQGALCGVVPFEGVLVPVVDLARWVDVGTAAGGPRGGARVLILRQAGRTLGLQVDSVDGLVEVPGAAIARLHHDADPNEVFHSAAQVPGSGEILSLLDVDRLAALAASWHEDETPAAGADLAEAAGLVAQPGRDYALLQLDGVRLGVPAGDLVEVMALPALEHFGAGIGGAWCRWRGRHLPVLSGVLPGLPQADGAPLLAVIEHEGLLLALPVRSVLALASFAAPDVDAGALAATVYDEEAREVHLLDTAALFARSPEALLSRPEAVVTGRAVQDSGIVNSGAYIVFEAGQLAATPIAAVGQIVPLAAGSAGATMPWNGAALPLVDLRPTPQAGAAGHVLIAAGDARPVGYIVARVELLVPAGSGKLYRVGAVDFITVDAGHGEASYRVVDLAQAARASITA
jgi:chemotaxis signal transduction protein